MTLVASPSKYAAKLKEKLGSSARHRTCFDRPCRPDAPHKIFRITKSEPKAVQSIEPGARAIMSTCQIQGMHAIQSTHDERRETLRSPGEMPHTNRTLMASAIAPERRIR
jgi:hypothetical protein